MNSSLAVSSAQAVNRTRRPWENSREKVIRIRVGAIFECVHIYLTYLHTIGYRYGLSGASHVPKAQVWRSAVKVKGETGLAIEVYGGHPVPHFPIFRHLTVLNNVSRI